MTLTAAAKIELIETTLADGKYRTLQKQLKELKDAEQITTRCYLSNSHELLKAEAQRIILELKPNTRDSQPGNVATAKDCYAPPLVDLLLSEHPDRCIVVSGFTNFDEYFKRKVSHLDGVFNELDNSWRFCLATLPLLLVYFPMPDYQHSDTLKREFEPIECGF